MLILFDVFSRLPLSVLHRLGALLGWIIYLTSKRYSSRLRENLEYSGIEGGTQLLHTNIREAGKGVMELPWVWKRSLVEVVASVKRIHGWEHLEAANALGKGVIMLTPHIGCFEVIGLYVAAHQPFTCMYRPPRYPSLDKIMHQGRGRGQMKLVPADLGGVRHLLKALKRGEAIGVLPDQVPGNGEGEWAPFFGRPAYTMTLIGRLIQVSGAPVVMCHSERLPDGEGFALYFSTLTFDPEQSMPEQLNEALETVIRKHPAQYLWSYNRYKVPRGALPPEANKDS